MKMHTSKHCISKIENNLLFTELSVIVSLLLFYLLYHMVSFNGNKIGTTINIKIHIMTSKGTISENGRLINVTKIV